MFRSVKNENGMTMLELIITMGILGFIMISAFQLINLNYQKVNKEHISQHERSELKIAMDYMMLDIPYSPYVKVENHNNFDLLIYEDYKKRNKVYKFSYNDGLYEVNGGVENIISKGVAYDESKKMVYIENDMVKVNFYSKDTNALIDLSIKRRAQN